MSWIKVFAPASIGNIGPGFDVLGLAIDSLGDTVHSRKIDEGVIISEITGENNLPLEAEKNTAGIAALEVLKKIGEKGGVELKIEKGVPSGSGLGSSASSAVAGAFAANYLYGEKLSVKELINPATTAESFVSGGFFADNTAPSLLGGATLTRNKHPLDVVKLGSIDELIITNIFPASEEPIENISSQRFVQELQEKQPKFTLNYITLDDNFDAIIDHLNQHIAPNDLILLLGAGKLFKIPDKLNLTKTQS